MNVPNSDRICVCRVGREGAAHCARGGRAPQDNCIVPAQGEGRGEGKQRVVHPTYRSVSPRQESDAFSEINPPFLKAVIACAVNESNSLKSFSSTTLKLKQVLPCMRAFNSFDRPPRSWLFP